MTTIDRYSILKRLAAITPVGMLISLSILGCGLSQHEIATLSDQCSRGDLASCQVVGTDHSRFGRSADAKEALGRACRGGYAKSCFNLGMDEAYGADYLQGKSHLEQGCALGHTMACSTRAWLAAQEGDKASAVKYY